MTRLPFCPGVAAALGASLLLAGPAYSDIDGTPDFSVTVNDLVFGSDALGLTPVSGQPGTFNTTGATSQSSWDFTFLFNLPTGGSAPSSIQRGEVTFTLADTGGSDGVEITNFDWAGLIDGNEALAILSVASGSCPFAGCSVTVGPQSAGPESGPGFLDDIGILISFSLSAGDSVTFDTLYEVTPVPLPAGLPLLLSVGAALTLVRRRRR